MVFWGVQVRRPGHHLVTSQLTFGLTCFAFVMQKCAIVHKLLDSLVIIEALE